MKIIKIERMTYDALDWNWEPVELYYDYLHYYIDTGEWKGWVNQFQLNKLIN